MKRCTRLFSRHDCRGTKPCPPPPNPPHPRCHMSTGRNSVELETTMTQKNTGRNSCHGGAETNRTRNHEVAGLIPGLAQGFKDLAFFRELWHKVSDVARIPPLLWLWLRLADAAPIQHQAWARARARGVGGRRGGKQTS